MLVGSGPSTEMGYASWHKLSEGVFAELKTQDLAKDIRGYEKALLSHQYPELLRQAEIDIGSKEKLCELVKRLLPPKSAKPALAYDYLVRWPFACYLTTNFDDEIYRRLRICGHEYSQLRCRDEDLNLVARDGAMGHVVKLHSDLGHPQEVVLTSHDYNRLYREQSGAHFRRKLAQILTTFPMLIIGHSLSDIDLKHVLAQAQVGASASHPIFLIAADFTQLEIRQYRENFNIEVLPYQNPDGDHRQLAALLARSDKFITPRSAYARPIAPPPSEESVVAAASIFVYRSIRRAKQMSSTTAAELLSPVVLQAMNRTSTRSATADQLKHLAPVAILVQSCAELATSSALSESLELLRSERLAHRTGETYTLTDAGVRAANDTAHTRATQRERAIGQFLLDLKASYPYLSPDAERKCATLLESSITSVSYAQGLSVADAIFGMRRPSRDELLDIFTAISSNASQIDDGDLRATYADTAFKFVVNPNDAQRDYLAALFQGYFLFHWLELDPNLNTAKQTFIRNSAWICDSSILLPMIATGCANHEYAVDFITRLRNTASYVFTTDKLLQEAWEHYKWAVSFVKRYPTDTPEFLAAALRKGPYKQNLFLDGYIRTCPAGGIGSFENYMRQVCPHGGSERDFVKHFAKLGFHVLRLESLDGYKDEDLEQVARWKEQVRESRTNTGTLRSRLQVDAEGEVLQIILGLRDAQYQIPELGTVVNAAYFVSQSVVLDRVANVDHVVSFLPSTMYRYLTSLPGGAPNPELLQQCMQGEYYDAGVSFVDTKRYRRYFTPMIESTRHSFTEELRLHIQEYNAEERSALGRAFESTPDLEKPFFAMHVGWQVAARARTATENATRRARQSDERARKAEAAAKKSESGSLAEMKKERRRLHQEANRLRNLQDPKKAAKLRPARKSRRRKKQRKGK